MNTLIIDAQKRIVNYICHITRFIRLYRKSGALCTPLIS